MVGDLQAPLIVLKQSHLLGGPETEGWFRVDVVNGELRRNGSVERMRRGRDVVGAVAPE